MSVKRCPKRECHDCKHVVDIEEDITGRDLITCELDACKYESCIKQVESVFRPCPLCGRRLMADDLAFVDDEGMPFEEMSHIVDFDNVADVKKNAMCKSDRIAANRRKDKRWMAEAEEVYEYAVSHVEYLVLSCKCGFHFSLYAEDVRFPEKGWLNRYCEKANRRATE